MKVVGHDHEIMKEIFALLAISKEDLDEQVGGGDALEYRSPLSRDGGDEECTVHATERSPRVTRKDVSGVTSKLFNYGGEGFWWKSAP